MKIPKFKALSKNQQRDYDCYLKLASNIKSYQKIDYNTEYISQTLEEWYFLWDTHGIVSHYSDIQKAGQLTQAKDTLNLTIKLWIEDVLESNIQPLLQVYEVWEYCNDFPKWVWTSFEKQLKKTDAFLMYQKVNYAPDNKTFWPPWMLDFVYDI